MQTARSGSDPPAIWSRYKQYSWSNDQYVDSSGIVLRTLNRSRRQKIRHSSPNSDAEIHICINAMLQYYIGVIPFGLPLFCVKDMIMVDLVHGARNDVGCKLRCCDGKCTVAFFYCFSITIIFRKKHLVWAM